MTVETPRSMSNPFARKMESFVRLPPEDLRALEAAVDKTRRFGPREDVIRDGEGASALDVLLDGWACRYKVLPDGRRQIVGLLIPGDMCDAHALLLPTMAHSLGTITAATLARVPGPAVGAMAARSAALAEALNWEALVGAEIQREWMVSLGRRTAVERLAHLFCEIAVPPRAGRRAPAAAGLSRRCAWSGAAPGAPAGLPAPRGPGLWLCLLC